MFRSGFLLVTVCLSAGIVFGQETECEKELSQVSKCIIDGQKPVIQPDLKDKLDQCWTNNGCEAPKPPPPPPMPPMPPPKPIETPGEKPPQKGPGGRAGPVPMMAVSFGNKCFDTVMNQSTQAMITCMKKADPSFEFPTFGGMAVGGVVAMPVGSPIMHPMPAHPPVPLPPPADIAPPPPPPSGVEGTRPMPPPFPHGVPPQPMPSGPPPPPPPSPLTQCEHFDKVGPCLNAVINKSLPTEDDMRRNFQQQCNLTNTCKKLLSAKCEAELKARAKAACLCGKEAQKKRDSVMNEDPSCKDMPKPPRAPSIGNEPDCNTEPENPCDSDYDTFMQRRKEQAKQFAAASRPINVSTSAKISASTDN